MRALLLAGTLCGVSIVAESVFAGRNPQALLRSLKQPSWAMPLRAWYLVGLAYYAACFLSAYRVTTLDPAVRIRVPAMALLAVVMVANALWNFVFFRRQDRKLSFWLFVPYTALVLSLIGVLVVVDRLSAFVFVLYVFYLPYALAWAYRVWKLNE